MSCTYKINGQGQPKKLDHAINFFILFSIRWKHRSSFSFFVPMPLDDRNREKLSKKIAEEWRCRMDVRLVACFGVLPEFNSCLQI